MGLVHRRGLLLRNTTAAILAGAAAALVFIVYTATLFVFYATMALSPLERFYRRPALIFYSRFNCLLRLHSNRIAAAN